jgi:hypothetical protein
MLPGFASPLVDLLPGRRCPGDIEENAPMTVLELTEIVDQRMDDPRVLGRLACNLRSSENVVQRHQDGRSLQVVWKESGDFWRCVISADADSGCLVQVDLHENATVRMEAYAPCRLTISPSEGILCLTRYR